MSDPNIQTQSQTFICVNCGRERTRAVRDLGSAYFAADLPPEWIVFLSSVPGEIDPCLELACSPTCWVEWTSK